MIITILFYLVGYLLAYIIIRKSFLDMGDEDWQAAMFSIFSWCIVIFYIICIILWCIFKPIGLLLDWAGEKITAVYRNIRK